MSPLEVFVVGYGNPMRGDDGVGQEVARALDQQATADLALWRGTVNWAHQLTPEMAVDVHAAELAVFIDAADDDRQPGAMTVRALAAPCPRPSSVGAPFAGCWQDISPSALLGLSAELYGSAPPGAVVSVTVGSTAPGFGLSPAVKAAVPVAVAAVRLVIARQHPLVRAGARPTAGSVCRGPHHA